MGELLRNQIDSLETIRCEIMSERKWLRFLNDAKRWWILNLWNLQTEKLDSQMTGLWVTYFTLDVINNRATPRRTDEAIGCEILVNGSDWFTSGLRLRKTAKRTSTLRAQQLAIIFIFWRLRHMVNMLLQASNAVDMLAWKNFWYLRNA